MSRRAASGAVGVLAALVGLLTGCADDGESAQDPAELAGSWDVSLVVGAIDADPDVEPALLPGDATFREHWRFEDCDDRGCTLRRPDGGLLLGDLDGVRVTTEGREGDGGADRLVGSGAATDPLPVEDATPCDGAETERWEVRVEVHADDGVLSGSVVRTPAADRRVVDGRTCFGIGVTLGLSGIPRADGTTEGQG